MGHAGGANEVHHIDNLTLKTELADEPVITGLQSTADSFSITFRDVGNAKVDADSIAVSLDGEDVTGSLEVSKDGMFTTVTYQSPTIFASGSEHGGRHGRHHNRQSAQCFTSTASTYARCQPTGLGDVDTSTPGFLMYVNNLPRVVVTTPRPWITWLMTAKTSPMTGVLKTMSGPLTSSTLTRMATHRVNSVILAMAILWMFLMTSLVSPVLKVAPSNHCLIETVVRVPDAGFYTFDSTLMMDS